MLFIGLDFYNGWKDAEKITKRSGIAAKFQAGFASVLSGLTLGIISPEAISNFFDTFKNKFVGLIKAIPERVKSWVNELRKIPALDKAFEYIIGKFDVLRNIVVAIFGYFSEKFEEFKGAAEEQRLLLIRSQLKHDEKIKSEKLGYKGGYDLTGQKLLEYIPGKLMGFTDRFKKDQYFRPTYLEVETDQGVTEPIIQCGS